MNLSKGQVVDCKLDDRAYTVRSVLEDRVELLREKSGDYRTVSKDEVVA